MRGGLSTSSPPLAGVRRYHADAYFLRPDEATFRRLWTRRQPRRVVRKAIARGHTIPRVELPLPPPVPPGSSIFEVGRELAKNDTDAHAALRAYARQARRDETAWDPVDTPGWKRRHLRASRMWVRR